MRKLAYTGIDEQEIAGQGHSGQWIELLIVNVFYSFFLSLPQKETKRSSRIDWQPTGNGPPSRFKRDDPANPARIKICQEIESFF